MVLLALPWSIFLRCGDSQLILAQYSFAFLSSLIATIIGHLGNLYLSGKTSFSNALLSINNILMVALTL